MTAQPAAKADELIKNIINLQEKEERDQFTLNKLKKEAKALLKTDAFHAHMGLGILAALEEDVEGMRKHHLTALKMYPNDPIANINYSTSLNNLGFYGEAGKYAFKAHKINPTELLCLDNIIEIIFKMGRIQETRKWLDNWNRVNPVKQHELNDLTIEISDFFLLKKINDDEFENLVKMALSILHDNQKFDFYYEFQIQEDEESDWLSQIIILDASFEEVVDLNLKLAEKLAVENPPYHLTDNVIISFSQKVD